MYCTHCGKEVEPIIENNNCHKVMCGDSTKEEDFAKLMKDTKADLVWTDPPYGVSYKGTNNPNGKDWGVMANDGLRDTELLDFLLKIYTNVAKYTKDNPALYTCYASINHLIFQQALEEAGFDIKQQLIWEKGHVLGHSDYHWSHEPVLYCRKREKNSEWFGDRTHVTIVMSRTMEQLADLTKEQLIDIISKIRENSDTLKIQKDVVTEYLHSTQKPVELSKTMIKNSSRPKDIVLEPCAGSGSTIIACHSSGRICYAMEIESKYVDVCLTRFRNYTGIEPIRESDGKTWAEIQNEK